LLVNNGQRFGKYYFVEKSEVFTLHPCEKEVCFDAPASRGSCYLSHAGEYFGHAIACDISEVECCGWAGCGGDGDYKKMGKWPNGTSHGYYWFAPGYKSRQSGCCHCAASCPNTALNCTDGYWDVTTRDCQRRAELGYATSYGYLRCKVPGQAQGTGFKESQHDIVANLVDEIEHDEGETGAPSRGMTFGTGMLFATAFLLLCGAAAWKYLPRKRSSEFAELTEMYGAR
jgi:hypothetical protein